MEMIKHLHKKFFGNEKEQEFVLDLLRAIYELEHLAKFYYPKDYEEIKQKVESEYDEPFEIVDKRL